MKRVPLILILMIAAFVCGLALNSNAAAPTVTYGFVPYDDNGSSAPSPILFNYGGNKKTLDFFGGYYYFGDIGGAGASTGDYFLGTGSNREINAEGDRLVFGDVQDNSNQTQFILRDADHAITLKANVILPELPNCAKLATDSNGKVICAP